MGKILDMLSKIKDKTATPTVTIEDHQWQPVTGSASTVATAVYTTGNTAPNMSWTTTTSLPGTFMPGTYTWGSSGSGSGGAGPAGFSGDDFKVTGDLIVKGVNILDMVQKINDRLAILVPDPVLLEKYEALREAYEHYKTLEALCKPEANHDGK